MNAIVNKIAVKYLRKWCNFLMMITAFFLAACSATPSSDREIADHSKASSKPPSEEIVSLYIPSKKGIEDFRSKYWVAEMNKAFASSDDGPWGWSKEMAIKEYATEAAMKRCESHLKPQDRKCKIVNINGIWIPHTVIPVSP